MLNILICLKTGNNWHLFITNEAGVSRLYLLNTLTNLYKQINGLPVGVYESVDFHNNNTELAISVNAARSPTDVYVLNTATGKIQRWTESETGAWGIFFFLS